MVRIKFEDSQDAICGIELTANGQKVAWSISSYLGELSKKVSDLVDAQSLQAIKSEPKPEAAKAPEPEAAKEPKSETAKAPEPETAKAPEPDTAKAPEPEAAKAPKPEPVALVEAK